MVISGREKLFDRLFSQVYVYNCLIYCATATKNNRRKRKKRCYNKKQRPKSSGSQSSDTSTTSEVADLTAVLPTAANQEGIFVMDDIESSEKVILSTYLTQIMVTLV